MLVQADDMRDAMNRLDEGMKGGTSEYSSICIKETNIISYLYNEMD